MVVHGMNMQTWGYCVVFFSLTFCLFGMIMIHPRYNVNWEVKENVPCDLSSPLGRPSLVFEGENITVLHVRTCVNHLIWPLKRF